MTAPLQIELPAEVVDQLVAQVADRIRGDLAQSSPWMTRAQAAVYLGWPVSRLEKRRDVPHVKDEGRVMYHRARLDAWLLGQT